MMKKLFKSNGFTVAEIMTVLFIFLAMTALVLASFRRGEQRSQFLLITEQIASDMRKMQTQSLTGIIEEEIVASGGFGIYFDTANDDQYLLFRDDGDEDYTVADTDLETVLLPANFTLSDLLLDPLTIVFKPPKPTIYINGAQAVNEVEIKLFSDKVSDKYGSVMLNRITGRIIAELKNI